MKKKRIKITYISNSDRPSGRTSRVFHYGVSFLKQNVNFSLVTSSVNRWTNKKDIKNNLLYKRKKINGIETIFYNNIKSKNLFLRFFQLLISCYNILRLFKKKRLLPDIIISSQPTFIGYVSSLIAKKNNIPFVYEIRDVWPETLISNKYISKYSLLSFLIFKLECEIYKYCSLVVSNKTNINKLKSRIYKMSSKKIRCIYIPNPQYIKKLHIKTYNKNNNKYLKLIYTGSFNKMTNVIILLKALNILKNKIPIKCTLIGEGYEKKKCIQYVKYHNIKNVKFFKQVSRNKIPNFIYKHDLCIATMQSSKTDEYGISFNKFIEYMGCKKPIILTGDSHRNPIKLSKCGYYCNSNTEIELAKKITKFYHLPLKKKKKMGINGYNFSNKNFNYTYYSKLYLDELIKLSKKSS